MAVRVSSPVLIGRATELERLQAALERARNTGSSTILVAGEAGVGKTRLTSDFAELAQASGVVVLLGGCIDLGEGAMPYAPVVEALRGFARRSTPEELDDILGIARPELARLVPDLGGAHEPARTEDGRASNLSIGSAQGRLFELLLGVLERLASRAPVLFIMEDLHWSDRSTRDLVAVLVRNLRDAAVVLLFTYRSDELHRRHPLVPFLAELERSHRVERLHLQPLDQRESAAQLRAIAGHDLDPDLVRSIHARAGGNAFFAEELLVTAGDDGRAELPATLRDVLLARVADLAEPTQGFLRVASAAGQRVDPALIATAATLSERALYDALRECVSRQVLVPDPTAGIERYAFRHALLQEAVYDELLPGERTRLHSAFARTLEAGPPGDPSRAAELAYHWYAAHDLPRAFESAIVAGLAAEARYAFPEAQTQYERAIELWDQVPDAEGRARRTRVDLLELLAGVARFHDPVRAASYVESAIALVDPDEDPVQAGLLHARLGRCLWLAGQSQLANQAYRDAVRLIPASHASAERARVLSGLAQILMVSGHYEESAQSAEQALIMARAVGARDIEGHARNTLGLDRAEAGDIDHGIDDIAASLAIAEEVGVVDDVGRAYANWIWVLDIAGRLEEAIALAAVGVAASERLGLMRFFGTHLLCGASDFLYRLGRWDESERAVMRAADVGPLGINEILTQELLGRLAMGRGRFGEALDHLRPLAPLAERAADPQFVIPVETSLAELAIWQGRPAEAAIQIAAGIERIDFTHEVRIGEMYAVGMRADADAAELVRARRSPAEERRLVNAGDELLEAIRARHAAVVAARPLFTALSEGWLRLCEAEASRLHRRADPDAWVASAEAWERLGRPYLVAYARWREAEARLGVRGDRVLVAASLRVAHAIGAALGARPLEREIRALAARARLPLSVGEAPGDAVPPSDGSPDMLTAREREVLGLVALGRTNREIAEALFISRHTAGVHVSNIIGKMGVGGRGEAAAMAYRLGLVEGDRVPSDERAST